MARKRSTITVLDALSEYEFVISELSEETQVWYVRRLKRFAKWCAEKRLHVPDLKPAHVAGYLQELRKPSVRTGKPLSTYTLHGHMRCIRTFLFWCAKPGQRYLPLEVAQNLVMPKVDTKVIEPFSIQQLQAMHVANGQNVFPVFVARNKAIMDVLVDTGIRASELCNLQLEHVHITAKEGYIKVMGKGRKEREVPLGLKSRKSLNEYIKRFRPSIHNENHVFLGNKQSKMTVTGLDQMLRRLGRHAKIKGVRVSAHTFRHTMAINFLLQGGDIYVLSRLLGHESVQVTEVYLRAIKSMEARKTGKSVLDNLK
ncbi:tyrosine-type recombinase/integrase [Dictyobacter kobayashii]|uniref:Tyrosine recombinase XerC n=1 Tax=Dictyobacter kobayashii TaxID=2014872 RepID=A0A402AIN2_9CHLR|nr:tyrosine-type recombinase/integrase [Dictyobacter kobayashii]GCE18982.1 tyrosine recombinase XerC [Dictyobacter kobayashii]